jgi:hypothetical protein
MQVTSLFAVFFAFLVAPLATLAMQIKLLPNITADGNTTITCDTEATDPGGPLTFFLVRNETRQAIAENVYAQAGTVTASRPANATGNGWIIQATSSNGTTVGVSPVFSIFAPAQTGKKTMAVPIVGGVIAAVIVVSLLVLALFIYMRRRRQRFVGPEFNLEANFPPRNQSHQISRSFSSTSTALTDPGVKSSKDLELEKVEWETRLEEQFARARAATPDIRGATPLPRSMTPVPLMPLRSATRNPSY